MDFIATCKLGLESVVAMELRMLGIQNVSAFDARVCFSGGYLEMARACLWLRSAERVLLVVGEFHAATFDELFEGTKALGWKNYLCQSAMIHVNGKSAKSTLFSVSDCQSIVKKAIVENLKTAYRTNIIPENGKKVIVEVGILKDTATLTLDCCGAGLSRRGYRTFNVAAPLSETLGAAILLLSRYHADVPLIDPMCGSGTMPIEAAMIAKHMAPGLNREFAAEEWPFVDAGVFAAAREQARDCVIDAKLDILGIDIDAHSVDLCKKHAKKAGIMVEWAVAPVKQLHTDKPDGLLVCNPPYGERMLSRRESDALYRDMHHTFDALPNWAVSIITSHTDFEKIYGKHADKRRKLSNGGIPCTLYQYFRERHEAD